MKKLFIISCLLFSVISFSANSSQPEKPFNYNEFLIKLNLLESNKILQTNESCNYTYNIMVSTADANFYAQLSFFPEEFHDGIISNYLGAIRTANITRSNCIKSITAN